MDRLDKYERLALEFLASCGGGGYSAGKIARECGHGSSRSQMALFRTSTLRRLFESGLITKIDDGTPAIFMITDTGRAALKQQTP